jgi:translation initiation factor IF-2
MGAILVPKVFGMMYYDYNKPSYLLPPGCKDLIDLLRLEHQKNRPSIQLPFMQSEDLFIASTEEMLGPWKLKKKKSKEPGEASLKIPPPREVTIPDEILIIELAKIAGQKPFKIIADLIEIGVFANVKQRVGFDAASGVLKKYGILAKRAV